MRRLLGSTTALALALANLQPWPLLAQTLTDDGSVIAADGTVLCTPTAEAVCDPADPALVKKAKKIKKRMAKEAAAAEAAAQAEAEAAAKAEADAAAAAQAEAEAAAKAEAEAAAKAEADAAAAAQAEAEAAAKAEAEAAAKAEADAAAAVQAEVEAAAVAAAEAEAAAKAEADAAAAATTESEATAEPQATEEPATMAAPEDATEPEATAAPEETAAPEVTVEPGATAEPEATVEPEAPVEPEATTEPEATVDPEAPAEPEPTEADAAALAEAEAELAVEPDGSMVDPAAGLATAEEAIDPEAAPVAAPVPTEDEVAALTDLLSQPEAEGGAVAAAAEAAEVPAGEAPAEAPVSDAAVAVVEEVLTEDSVRASTEEFAAAPKAVSKGKKDKLSNLEKFGLIALGALAVGAIINENNNNANDDNAPATPPRQVVSNTGDRVVILNPDGTYQVYKDDDAIIRQPGSTVRTETYKDGSSRTVITRADGSQIVTIRDALGRVLHRAAYDLDGREVILIDDLAGEEPVDVATLPKPRKKPVVISTQGEDAALQAALAAQDAAALGRTFSLRQIREIAQVRWLAPLIDVDPVTFDSGSSAIKASEAAELAGLGRFMQDMIDENPGEMFLIEGHTDAVGKAAMNLALSDRRAESVALALTEYFDIPPENMVIQGYGETELLIDTEEDEVQNRRVAVRIITPLLRGVD